MLTLVGVQVDYFTYTLHTPHIYTQESKVCPIVPFMESTASGDTDGQSLTCTEALDNLLPETKH